MDDSTEIKFNSTNKNTYALAQLVKRIGWQEVRSNAVSDDEAESMMSGICALQEGLAKSGFSPR